MVHLLARPLAGTRDNTKAGQMHHYLRSYKETARAPVVLSSDQREQTL